ncbi:MAG: FHA domain-containing protein [Myxococcales bacterium]|nr:FHA domain-containing protein [Myxococcales bacterium]
MWRVTAFDRDGREIARLEVNGGELTIGRDTDRQLVLPSASVSRRHARLVLDGPQPFVVDEGSANGVIVNGVRIAGPTAVVPGVRVDIAEFHLEFEVPPPMTEAVSPISARQPPVADPDDVIRLIAEGGPFDGRIYEIPPGDLTVGRAVDNDVVLDDPSLSRKHCRLRRAGAGRIELEDLGSSNGTFVNGRKVGKGAAGPGDTVRFGELGFRVEGASSGGTRSSQASPGGGGGRASSLGTWLVWGGVALVVIGLGVGAAIFFLHKGSGGGKDAITLMAEQAAALVKAGKEKMADKKFDGAAADFEAAIKIDPANGEVRRLKSLAEAEPQHEKLGRQVAVKADLGDRSSFESAMRFLAQIPVESMFRAPNGTKLSKKLVGFGDAQCRQRKYADCAWAICKAYDVAPPDARPGSDASALLKEAEKKLVKDKTYTPCKKH